MPNKVNGYQLFALERVSLLGLSWSCCLNCCFLEESDLPVEQEVHAGDDDSGLARVEGAQSEREGEIQQSGQGDERSPDLSRYGIQSMTKQCNGRFELLV